MSLQLEHRLITYDGEDYDLVCNMAALDDLQEAYGDMDAVAADTTDRVAAQLLLSMLNRAAKKKGSARRFTLDELKENLSYGQLRAWDIFGMMVRSLATQPTEPGAEGETAKN